MRRRRILFVLAGVTAVLSLQAGPALAERASGVCGGVPPAGYHFGPGCELIPN